MSGIKYHAHIHFIVLLWGFTAILGLLITIPVVELVFLRTLIAGLLLWAILRMGRIPITTSGSDGWKLLGTGLIFGVHWIFFFQAARESNVSVALVGLSTLTLWTALLEPLIKPEKKLHFLELGIGVIIVFGIYLIFQTDFTLINGMIMALISAICAALFTIINSRFTSKYHHFSIMAYEMVGATVAIGIFLVVYQGFLTESQPVFKATALDWLWIVILSSVCTVYAYSMSVKLMQNLTAYTINLAANLEPVYGIILALLIFGENEHMTPIFYVGALVILAAIFAYLILNRKSSVASRKSGSQRT